jgi:CRP/FNR family transcriptional regulator, nitrogen oxide reductase regulator
MRAGVGRLRTATFESVPAHVAACCVRMGQSLSVSRGTVLTRQGDDAARCYYVRAGYARVLSTSPAGNQVVVGYLGPRDVVGQAAAMETGRRYAATTIAAGPMDLIGWDRDAALRLADRFPEVHARLDALLARNVAILMKRLHTVSGGTVPRRLADALLELAARHGTPDVTGIAIAPRVTREDLAGLTGTTMYTVSRVLASWQHQGLLTTSRGRLRVTNPARLRVLARRDD